ncbi:hypothetical protein PM594_13040 [Erysipelatoclostridium ramosum]|uniref:hypothetical protein n=1 Tax=Thomasclavelia ramosa TaxID=1547 RepID=UPI00189D0358|nr:hypothetical protein [Thomasclavelia ramosa]MDB7040475.1 hypothetical protein [Thomasclavelia ramosa]
MNVTLRHLNYSIYHTFNSSASGKLTDLGKTEEKIMIVVIKKGGVHSFVIRDRKTGGFGINIAPGDDIIKVFQWAIDFYRQGQHGLALGGVCNG